MAYVNFQKEFWSDDYILKLNPQQKLVYLYIITNEKTTQCGIYEIPIIKATTELGLSAEEFILNLKKFHDDKKIHYSMDTQELCIINWRKHNENTSWKTYEKVRKELSKVKNPNLVVLLYDPRIPLFDGTKKVKIGENDKGKAIYKEEMLIIENPWKERFIQLTDEMLQEIRKPYDKTTVLQINISPMEGAYKGHLPYTYTNTLHNITNTNSNTLQKQNTETSDYEGHYEKPYIPSFSLPDKITEAINHWNTKKNLPSCKYSIFTLPDVASVKTKFDVFRDGEILKAIDNLDTCYDKIDPNYRPKAFHRFIINSLDNWLDEAEPLKNYDNPKQKKSRTLDEESYMQLLRLKENHDVDQETFDKIRNQCIKSLADKGIEFDDEYYRV